MADQAAADRLEALLTELEDLGRSWESDEEADGARVSEALGVARELAPSLDEAQGDRLSAAIDRVIRAAGGRRERLAGKLKELADGRRAVRGYGSLKSHKLGQKIRVKV